MAQKKWKYVRLTGKVMFDKIMQPGEQLLIGEQIEKTAADELVERRLGVFTDEDPAPEVPEPEKVAVAQGGPLLSEATLDQALERAQALVETAELAESIGLMRTALSTGSAAKVVEKAAEKKSKPDTQGSESESGEQSGLGISEELMPEQ